MSLPGTSPHARARAPHVAAAAILLLLAAASAAIWWYAIRPQRRQAAAAVSAAGTPLPLRAGSDAGNSAVQPLLAAAREAMREQRLVAPVQHNAVALYLQARQLDPGARAAADALREIFPFAAQAVEQTINAGDLDEAQRELDLLRRVDATNYTLTLLQAKLSARRQAHEVRSPAPAAPHRRVVATPRPATVGSGTDATAAVPRSVPAVAVHSHAVAAQRPATAAAPVQLVAAATQKAAVTQPPLLLHMVQPYYPVAAQQAHRSGWVDVGYTVTPQGHVSQARVIRARPQHLFERAALAAVRHWRFRPATRQGVAVAVQVVSRVDFNPRG